MQRQMGFVGRGVRLDFTFLLLVFAGTPHAAVWEERAGPSRSGPGICRRKMGRWEGGRRSFLARPALRIRCPASFPRGTGRRVYPNGGNTKGSHQYFPFLPFSSGDLTEKIRKVWTEEYHAALLDEVKKTGWQAGQERPEEKCTFLQCLLPATSRKV
ncbi:hypothetical protein BDP81DRAFT_128072 [Colletotrichum phormii]|uniref:Uncharacterized protein n=1 Tax=Colletotrichum phormii TaxID=359342 RepID=A0AAJ0EJ64_9PEZI|nr:uncharacterized protein BDP81DRAFT_128072 [Colletotrichum phormii]KAK1641138.1 hypothetical protein BDP81DRAFT_128072 [Colletotrichum phormii]